jgi:hypothetical protein
MHRVKLVTAIAVAHAVGWNVMEVTAAAQAGTQAQVLDAPSHVVAHQSSVSRNEASLQFMLANGDALTVSFGSGQVFVERAIGGIRNRQVVAEYERGGELETAWIKLVSEAGRLDPREMLALVRAWQPSALGTEDQKAFESATTALSNLVAAAIAHPEDGAGEIDQAAARDREEAVAGVAGSMSGLEALQALEALRALEGLENLEGLEGLAALEGLESLKGLEEAVRALEQLEAIGGLERIAESVPVPEERALSIGAIAGQIGGDLVGLLAAFIALSALGFGLVFFAPRQLEIVADTVRNSFWRSFMVGLFAQPLVVPVFGMLLLGLALTVVGIVIIPFAAAGFAMAAALAVTGGYLAVARSIGEAYLRQRMSQGYAVGSWLSYRYIVYGLVALMTIWLPAVLIGAIPVAGDIATVSAALLTWMLATAGFGATILSRAGIRGTFTRRFDQALSDEYLYQTPQATPIVRRHERISKD